MYSKVKILGHPVHPMLVAFPTAFYTSTLASLIIYVGNEDPFWFDVAYTSNVAAVAMALIAAVPGLVDWLTGIPAGTRAKRDGLTHLLLNAVALLLFAVNIWVLGGRTDTASPAAGLPILLSGGGLIFVIAAGFYGYRLVQKHHVGIELTQKQIEIERTRS